MFKEKFCISTITISSKSLCKIVMLKLLLLQAHLHCFPAVAQQLKLVMILLVSLCISSHLLKPWLNAESLGVSMWVNGVCVLWFMGNLLVAVSQCWDKIQQPLKKMDGWIYGEREGGERGGLLNLSGFKGPSNHWKAGKNFFNFWVINKILEKYMQSSFYFYHQSAIIWTTNGCIVQVHLSNFTSR